MMKNAQTRLTDGLLLDGKGNLIEAGYHTSLVRSYDRKMIRVKGMRSKEWDYYYIGNDQYGIAFTVADNSYLWLSSITFFDFIKKTEITKTDMGWFPMGKLGLPNDSSSGDIIFKKKNFSFQFLHEGGARHLIVTHSAMTKSKSISCDLILTPSIKDSMVIATPFEKKKHFYYNQKINLLKAEGTVILGQDTYSFKDNVYGVLDWGRGVWTYKNTWYWSSLSGVYQGHKLGFNLGYGFGNTSKATENMLFFDDETFKLEDVEFNIPMKDGKDDYLSIWTLTSKNNAINLKFEPILDRYSGTNVIIIKSIQHQVFGKFSGSFVTDSGKVITFENMLGFAEKVQNNW
jgi:hypothetical protein